MPFKKGQSGNPGGRAREKKYLTALNLALHEDADIPHLRAIAQAVIQEARKGEAWAVNHIADRLDGKPAQAIVGDSEADPIQLNHALEVSSAKDIIKEELATIAKRGSTDSESDRS